MARQKSANPLSGKIGGITYFKGKDGWMARDGQGIDGKRIKTDERYERTRENASEFGRAAKGMKEIRLALNTILKKTSDSRAMTRLSKLLFQILKTDPVNARGEREVALGDISLLNNFQFNIAKDLKTALDPRFYTSTMNRETGEATITIQSFNPRIDLSFPDAANHFRFVMAAVEVDFENLQHNKFISSSNSVPLNTNATEALTLTTTLAANSTRSLILVFGIRFEDVVNGVAYPLNDSSYNTLAIIETSQATV